MRFLLAVSAAVLTAMLWADPVPGFFQSSFPDVLAIAQKEEKSILLFFNSSDHSGLGMKMKKEALLDRSFLTQVEGQLLAYEVDFPLHHDLPKEQAELHRSLRNQYHVDILPCLMLLNSQGEEIVRMGYLPLDGGALASDLMYLLSLEGEVHARLAQLPHMSPPLLRDTYEKALRLAHHNWMVQILEQGAHSEEPVFFLVELYRHELFYGNPSQADAIRKVLFELDPNNVLGCHYDLAMIDFQFASQHDQGEEMIRPLIDYLTLFGRNDREHSWKIDMMIAQYFLNEDCLSNAWDYAQQAWATAPEDKKQEIAHLLDYIHDHSRTACNQ